MHKYNIVIFGALAVVSIAGGIIGYSNIWPTTSGVSLNNSDLFELARERVSKEFTTVVTDQLAVSTIEYTQEVTPEPVKDPKPIHASDILKFVEFEQNKYIATATPNDQYFPLWFQNNINLPQAWDTTVGSESVTIAIIDTGFALSHTDLQNRWFINQGEMGNTQPGDSCWTGTPVDKKNNACDDDDNGYPDDWRGWDFFNIDNSPQAGESNPSGSGVTHGTIVAGLTAATANNRVGLAGVDWTARIMPLQVLSDDGSGYTSDIVAAVEYAVDNGANVINMSLGGSGNDPALEAAVNFARANGVVVVAASGNCATLAYNFCYELAAPGYMGYPALYESVIAVGATDQSGNRAGFSSYGPALDVVAPGANLSASTTWSSANPFNGYASGLSGTSFASPIVAGLSGLLLSLDQNLSFNQIKVLLTGNADRAGNFNNQYGFGQIRADLSVLAVSQTGDAPTELTTSDRPVIESDKGINPAQPVSLSETITTEVRSYQGDQLYMTAKHLNTGQTVTFPVTKTGEDGLATFSYSGSTLGAGPWKLTPFGLQFNGLSEVIYIGS